MDRDSFDELYDVHEGARAALKKAKQFVGGHVYQVTYYDDWMVASKAFYDSSRINIVTAFAFALIIMLCATANWIVTLIAFGSLVTTVSTTLALMVFYGWELNVIESIDVSIAGGMAVDYVLHMSHAYNHQDPSLTSSERVSWPWARWAYLYYQGALRRLARAAPCSPATCSGSRCSATSSVH